MQIPKECKRLAEVDFPIAVVSAHSAREKSIRHGHPSTLHLWWARRPLAACRAMLLALLLPDPCDDHCPAGFKSDAPNLLQKVQGKLGRSDLDLRKALLKFIGDFANWDLAANPTYLEVGRGLIKAAHGEEPPLVVDPFAGGGSIPLEALRLGCEASASDLNPVACLILKVMLEDIPRYGPDLGEELRRTGAEIRKQAENELSQCYPRDPDGATPIAYLWARTVTCESPNCGAEIPLIRSCWLSKKAGHLRALKYDVKWSSGGAPSIVFSVFTPKSEKEVPRGTISLANASCPACNHVLPKERVRAQLSQVHGGSDPLFDEEGRRSAGALLLAVITSRAEEQGRCYRPVTPHDYDAVRRSIALCVELKSGPGGLSPLPDEDIPQERVWRNNPIRVHHYGMTRWRDLFTSRQGFALAVLIRNLRAAKINENLRGAVCRALTLAISRQSDYQSTLCTWGPTRETIGHTFGRQALPMVWDFAEVNPFSGKSGCFEGALDWIVNVCSALPKLRVGQVNLVDAVNSPLPTDSASIFFTDPPYYDAVPYAKLANYFYVWQRRALFDADPELFSLGSLTGSDECVVDEARGQDRGYFERKMSLALAEGRRVIDDSGIGSIVFAHKTTEGWEALLAGIVESQWVVTASWPIQTEMGTRLRAMESAALGASVHLVCRPRPEMAEIGDWAHVLRELNTRIGDWMERLSSEGVRGADLVFSCIGPAMEVYSRYRKVEDAEGRDIPLGGDPEETEPHKRGFLAYVWEIVGRTALSQVLGTAEARARNGAAGALEEDARLTALFLWTHQSTSANDAAAEAGDDDESEDGADNEAPIAAAKKGLTLIYDVVRRFSQPLGIHLDAWNERIIETKKGIVRLLPVKERAEQLLGEDGASGVAEVIERSRGGPINYEFAFAKDQAERRKRDGKARKHGKSTPDEAPTVAPGTTTLDRVHIAMLLQASGKSNALRTMLKSEQERGADFLRLANALSALYPRESEEKRLLDAMILAVPR